MTSRLFFTTLWLAFVRAPGARSPPFRMCLQAMDAFQWTATISWTASKPWTIPHPTQSTTVKLWTAIFACSLSHHHTGDLLLVKYISNGARSSKRPGRVPLRAAARAVTFVEAPSIRGRNRRGLTRPVRKATSWG